jgi:hypothetical protein
LLTQSFSIPGVDGVAVAIGWNAIEPSMGQYDWTLLDQWIAQVSALGKKIDLVVPAGVSTPAWLFQAAPAGAGASPLNFTITPHGGQTDQCQPETIAAPWDPAFLSQWDAMLVALAAHLKTAGTYSAVTLVRLTGINRTTEELRLPAETAQSTGLACVTNAIVTWQQAGYRPSLLLQGWNAILGSFLKSFPDKTFAVSIIPNGAFPAIDDSGAAIAGTPPDQDLPLLTSASQKLPGRLVVQFDFLMPGEQASAVTIGYATKLNTFLAFQTNEYAGGSGAACSEPVSNPTPCIDSTFLTLLQTGIYPSGQSDPLRPQYIEVFHDNAAAFPGDILTAHGELLPPGIAKVANAEGESPTIAPNTWVEIKGSGLSLTGDSRIWQTTDFVGNQLPTQLDGVSATVNGKPAYLYYISPSQVNILTPPDAIPGAVQVVFVHRCRAGVVTVVFRFRWHAPRGRPFEWKLCRPYQPICGADHTRQAGRTRAALRQRLWTYVGAGGKWIDYPRRHAHDLSGDSDRRYHGERAVRRPFGAGRVSVQRVRAGLAGGRRSTRHRKLRRLDDADRCGAHGTSLRSGARCTIAAWMLFNNVQGAVPHAYCLRRNPGLTAIVCLLDVMAVGAMRDIRELGLGIPEDVSATGFDNIEVALVIRRAAPAELRPAPGSCQPSCGSIPAGLLSGPYVGTYAARSDGLGHMSFAHPQCEHVAGTRSLHRSRTGLEGLQRHSAEILTAHFRALFR